MKLFRFSALVLTGAVAVALTACEPEQDSADGSTDESASTNKDEESSEGDGGDGDGDNGTQSDPAEVSSVTLTKSGGISGIEETLEIDANGAWKYTKARMAPKKGELSDKEKDELVALAADSRIDDADKKSDKQCNDMQTYSLVIQLDEGEKVEADTDECGVSPNKQFDDLVNLLSEATPI